MDVSKNRGKTPKSSILIWFSIIKSIHVGGNTPIFGFTPIEVGCKSRKIGEQKTNLHPTSLESLPWIPACWAFSLGSRNFGGIRKSCEQALARQDC